MTNGNGKVDPRIQEAQRRLLKAREPLTQLDDAISKLQQQAATVSSAIPAAAERHTKASHAYVDDDSAANRKALLQASEDVQTYEAKEKVLIERLGKLAAQRHTLDAAVQAAEVVMGQATTEVRMQALEAEIQTARYRIAQHQEGINEQTRRFNAAQTELRNITLAAEDASQRANQIRMREQFRRTNPDHPALREPTMRNSF